MPRTCLPNKQSFYSGLPEEALDDQIRKRGRQGAWTIHKVNKDCDSTRNDDIAVATIDTKHSSNRFTISYCFPQLSHTNTLILSYLGLVVL